MGKSLVEPLNCLPEICLLSDFPCSESIQHALKRAVGGHLSLKPRVYCIFKIVHYACSLEAAYFLQANCCLGQFLKFSNKVARLVVPILVKSGHNSPLGFSSLLAFTVQSTCFDIWLKREKRTFNHF